MTWYVELLPQKCSVFDVRARVGTARVRLWVSLAPIFVNGNVLAEVENISLKWGEVRSVIADRTIETVLAEAIALKGRVRTVTADSLELDIVQTSDPVKYPKGHARVPKDSLSNFQFTEVRGRWRAIGTAVGAGAGGAAGIPIYSWMRNEGAEEKGAAFLAGFVGAGAAIGFLGGHSADKRTVIVSIVPD